MQKLDKSKVRRGILNKEKLSPHLDRAIALAGDFDWQYNIESKKGDEAFHPSSHCLPSPLEIYNSIFDTEQEQISASLRKTFSVGHFWHGYIYYLLVEKLEFTNWSEIEAQGTRVWGMNGDGSPKPYHYSQGKADVARCSIPKHGDYLIDVKTMNSLDFRTPGLPHRFHYKYIAQINIYLDFFDMEKAIILKVQKDSPHDFAEVEVFRNQELIDAIYDKWKMVGLHVAEEFPPPADLTFDLPFGDVV